MALPTIIRDEESWKTVLQTYGIPENNAETYAKTFVEQQLTEQELPDLSKDDLKELGITIKAHQIKVLKISKVAETPSTTPEQPTKTTLPCNMPSFTAEMTSANFRTAQADWTTVKSINPQAGNKAVDLLYSCCTEPVRKTIINTIPNFRS